MELEMYGNFVGGNRPWRPLGNRRGEIKYKVETNLRDGSASLCIVQRV